MDPLIIEVALNGGTPKKRNPHVPVMPAEITADALATMEAGAAIVHSHIERFELTGDAAVERYLEGYAPVLAARPDAILWGTVAAAKGVEARFGHYRGLAAAGMRMGAFDPGSVNLGSEGPDGLPGMSIVYSTSFDEIAGLVALVDEARLGPAIAIYEPGWLRTTLAYKKAGRLPAGAFVKLYFNGRYNFIDGKRSNIAFGLPPTQTALDAYLELLSGSKLPWAVAAIGDCVIDTGLARLAIERGGHVRVGLEDFGGERQPTNVALVEEVVALAKAAGRKIATPAEAARILGLPK
ncbi:3-keto-5-aminohexanoate cleavage protein [Polymorphobacter arshaanensis]|uniref:3-keto-5-aminohexanoate cleavage protein n=1 Tax=Glacieibacterium arshaanense TaxID=2511025 RepID=A0A4Y9ERR3_9SPHN|nr:3-keto-5-aminohexanoate cleavage protein [Polymorphobacter arshaanensis]TFU06294.1 3-keto-5-aminohexanoate cleavage protein [Polymorphobacter arshaanensis]